MSVKLDAFEIHKIEKHLSKKGLMACPECQSISADIKRSILQHYDPVTKTADSSGLVLYTFSCMQCGSVRQFNAEYIR